MSKPRLISIILILVFGTACLCAGEKMLVMTSISAQNEAVQAIAGEYVTVQAMLPTGASPETYSPSAKQIAQCSKAKLYLSIGVPLEKGLLPKLQKSFASLQIIDTTRGMALRSIDGEEEHNHDEDEAPHQTHEHDHVHTGTDPHVWFSVPNMCIHAKNTTEAIIRLLPEHAEEIQANYEKYIASLNELQKKIEAKLLPLNGKSIAVYHPAYGYLLDMGGIKQLAVEQRGHAPSAKHLAEMKSKMSSLNCTVLFTQPQSNPVAAQKTADMLGLKMQILTPLPEHYTQDMLTITNAICAGNSSIQ